MTNADHQNMEDGSEEEEETTQTHNNNSNINSNIIKMRRRDPFLVRENTVIREDNGVCVRVVRG